MTSEEAIHALDTLVEAYGVAINALRKCLEIEAVKPEKLDRSQWKECPNCVQWKVYGYRNYKPAYCRDCGRPINKPAWAELERRFKIIK